MADFIQLTLAGLALGSIYALVALGFVIIYRASQVFNFAQVEFLTLGAFLMVALSRLGLRSPHAPDPAALGSLPQRHTSGEYDDTERSCSG